MTVFMTNKVALGWGGLPDPWYFPKGVIAIKGHRDIENEIDTSFELVKCYNKTIRSGNIFVLDSSELKDNGIYKQVFVL